MIQERNRKPLSLFSIVILCIISIGTGVTITYLGNLALLIVPGVFLFCILCMFIFKKPFYGLLLVVFFLPFERIGSLEFAGSTIRIAQIFAFIAMISWVLSGLARKKLILQKNFLTLPVLICVGAMILSLINAQNITRSGSVLLFTLFVMGFAFVIPNIVSTTKQVKNIVVVLFWSAFIVSIFGMYQFLGDIIGLPLALTGLREQYTSVVFGFPRIQSTASEPLYFANYLIIPVSLALTYFLKKESILKPLWLFGLSALFILNLALTLSRGGYLGLFVVLIALAVFFFKNIFTFRNVIAFAVVGAVVLFGVQYFINLTGLTKSITIFTDQATNYSEGVGVEERYENYSVALELFKEHPIIGVGIGNFGPAITRQPFKMPETGWPIVNNETLEILAETGVIGLAAFIFILITLLSVAFQEIRKTRDQFLKATLVGFVIAFIGILAQYQTFSTLYILHVWFVVGMIIAIIHMCRAAETISKK